jgi:thioredoxin reductase (NADPH)
MQERIFLNLKINWVSSHGFPHSLGKEDLAQMAAITELNFDTFNDAVEAHEMVIIDFWAEWCGPCKVLAPAFEELSRGNSDIFFAKVNTELNRELSEALQIRSIPTIMAFKRGELVMEVAGLPPAQQLMELPQRLRALTVSPPEESSSEGQF